MERFELGQIQRFQFFSTNLKIDFKILTKA